MEGKQETSSQGWRKVDKEFKYGQEGPREGLVLFHSKIFGGMSNEIVTLLDQSKLKGLSFTLLSVHFCKGYMQRVVVVLHNLRLLCQVCEASHLSEQTCVLSRKFEKKKLLWRSPV